MQRSGIDANQVPHLTRDTNGKVTNSQLDTTNESQEASPFPAGDHRAHINRRTQSHTKHKTEKNIKDPQKKYRLGTVSKIFYWMASTGFTAPTSPLHAYIRYAASLSGSLPGLVNLLKAVLSFMPCSLLRVQWVGMHCSCSIMTIWGLDF